MLNITQINTLQTKLAELLPRLKAGEFAAIEYGDALEPCGGYMSSFRIRYIATLGGDQFTVKAVSNHQEGSGFYSPDEAEIVRLAMDSVLHYHRDTPFKTRLAEMRNRNRGERELSFFQVTEDALAVSHAQGNELSRYKLHG